MPQVDKAERKMPWLRFAEAQEKYKTSRDILQAAQKNLADVKAEVAQSAGPLKCVVAGCQRCDLQVGKLGYKAVISGYFMFITLPGTSPVLSRVYGASRYGLGATSTHTAGCFSHTGKPGTCIIRHWCSSDTACLSHVRVVRRELEQLEKRLKAEKSTVDKERRRLDTIRADHLDALIKKVGPSG